MLTAFKETKMWYLLNLKQLLKNTSTVLIFYLFEKLYAKPIPIS